MTADVEKESLAAESNPIKSDIFDVVGGDGLWQRAIFVVALLYAIPAATHNLSMSFLAPNLDHWCARPEGSNWTVEQWKELALPQNDMQCSRYKNINESAALENGTTYRTNEIESCDSWEYDTSIYSSTVLSEWNLVCDRKWLVSMSKTVFMAGVFVANMLFGYLADTWGRRPVITVAAAIAVCSAMVCAFSTSFIMFIVTRFFVALGLSGVFNVIFVLLMEVVGPQRRSFYGIAMEFGWCIGFVSLPGIAWIIPDWFWIQIVLTVPCLLMLGTWWILPESPRWLMSKGRVDEAQETLVRAATVNGIKVVDIDTRLKKIMAKASEVHESGEAKGNFLDLLRTPGLWQMTLNIYLMWFVNSFVYYGLSYNTNELAGNPFVNFALSGAVEFPAYVLTIFAITSMGRRNSLAGAMIIGGIACLLVYFLPQDPWWASVTVSMVGKFCITCSFSIAYVFTAEIFPTVVRNVGLGSASVFARFGSILAPFVRELGSATHPVVPQIVFGVLAFVSGVLVLLLPETTNVSVPETLAEAASRRVPRKQKLQNGHHVALQMSSTVEETSTTVVPPVKSDENGKKLADVPEEESHCDSKPTLDEDLLHNPNAEELKELVALQSPSPSTEASTVAETDSTEEPNNDESEEKTNF